MTDEFLNRLGRHRKTLAYLDIPANVLIWQNQPPLRFTALVADLRAGCDEFGSKGAQQSAPVSAEEKRREERELEDHAYPLASALYQYYVDQHQEADAAEWAMYITDWRKLREQALLDKALRLHVQLLALPSGSGVTIADDYNLTPARIAAFKQEYDEYAAAIGEPGANRATRRGLSTTMRPRMRILDGYAEAMDTLVHGFRGTPAGDEFVTGYFSARRVDDLGHGPSTPPAPPTP